MDVLFNLVLAFLREYSRGGTVWLAYSGGLDSRVLFDLLIKCREIFSFDLRIIHVNHGVHPLAQSWQIQCEQTAKQFNVPFFTEALSVAAITNVEETLRVARYAVFKKHLKSNDLLLTAHHQTDQAETILLQMLRGAGPKGLAAMPMIKPFGCGRLGRPLLSIARQDLFNYAQHHALNWIEDPSNQNTQFTRNFLRQVIFPQLAERWPTVTATLSRVAAHCAWQEKLLAEYIQQDLVECAGTQAMTLSVKKLLIFDVSRRQAILRAWLVSQDFILPSQKKLNQLATQMLTAQVDRHPYLTWGQVEIRRYRDDLYAMQKLVPHDPTQIIPGEKPGITIRFRRGGEKIRVPGSAHRKCLKNFFQEQGIPPWLRDRIPLVYVGEELVDFLYKK